MLVQTTKKIVKTTVSKTATRLNISMGKAHLLFAQVVAGKNSSVAQLLRRHGVLVRDAIDIHKLNYLLKTDKQFARQLYKLTGTSITDKRIKQLITSGKITAEDVGRRIVIGFIRAEEKHAILSNYTSSVLVTSNLKKLQQIGEYLTTRFKMAPGTLLSKYMTDSTFQQKVNQALQTYIKTTPNLSYLASANSTLLTYSSLRVSEVYSSLKHKIRVGAPTAIKETSKTITVNAGKGALMLGMTGGIAVLSTFLQGPFREVGMNTVYMLHQVSAMVEGLGDQVRRSLLLAQQNMEAKRI